MGSSAVTSPLAGRIQRSVVAVANVDVRLAIGDDDHTDARQPLSEQRHQAIAGPFGGLERCAASEGNHFSIACLNVRLIHPRGGTAGARACKSRTRRYSAQLAQIWTITSTALSISWTDTHSSRE